MTLLRTPAEMQRWALGARSAGRRIGCVPTMGCLHDGHLSLVRCARERAGLVVLTLFVNPAQFGPQEDLARYPRTEARDLELCRAAGVDAVFVPAAADMYAPGHSVYVMEERLGRGLCGAGRSGHFRGVCTVVAKLFNLTLPHVAVFGRKDFQQAAIVRRMVRDLNFPVEIVVAPTVREADGLAMSSRNRFLDPTQRRQALGLSRCLAAARGAWAGGETGATAVCARMRARLAEEHGLRVEYVEAVDGTSLDPAPTLRPGVVLAVAAFAGDTRLIDNTVLGEADPGLPDE